MTRKILVATKAPFTAAANAEAERVIKEAGLEYQFLLEHNIGKLASDPELQEALHSTNALIIRGDKVTQDIVDAAPGLELIIRGGAGTDNVQCMDYCTGKGITVMNTPGMNSNAVAELALSMALDLARGTHVLDQDTKDGGFSKGKYEGRELAGKRIGFHGFGYVGQYLARRLRGFEMEMVAYDPEISASKAQDFGVKMVKKPEEMYEGSFVVSLHLPKNKKTIGLVDMKLLELMQRDGMLINTARAEVVNEDDVFAFMTQNERFKYGADVHAGGDDKNIVDGDQRKRRFEVFGHRAILTPHIGAEAEEANFRTAQAAAREAVGYFLGGDITCAVNKDAVPPWMRDYADLAQIIGRMECALNPGQLTELKLVCYGDLKKYDRPFAGNALKGVYGDAGMNSLQALKRAEEGNIRITYIEPDNTKGRGNSVTIDHVIGENGNRRIESIRGTIVDGEKVIARVGQFNNVNYALPEEGVVVIFQYRDRAGMIEEISRYFKDAGISIDAGNFKQNKGKTDAMWIFNTDAKNEQGVRDILGNIKVEGLYKAAAVRID